MSILTRRRYLPIRDQTNKKELESDRVKVEVLPPRGRVKYLEPHSFHDRLLGESEDFPDF